MVKRCVLISAGLGTVADRYFKCCALRYSETAGYLRMEPTPGFTSAGVSFETRMRMFNPKKDTVTNIQFLAPSKVRYFTQYPGVSESRKAPDSQMHIFHLPCHNRWH